MFFRSGSLAILGSLALVACGGGGGSGSSVPSASAAAPFTITGYSAVATPVASSMISVASSGNVLDALSADSSATPAALTRGDAVGIARWAISNWGVSNRVKPAAVEPVGGDCPAGGSLSGSVNDRDNNLDLSSGDSLSLTFSNCKFAQNDLPVSGGFALTVNSVTFDQAENIVAGSFSATFTNLGTAGNLLNGAVSMQINADSYTASYSNFTASRGSAAPTVMNITVSTNATQVNVVGTMTVSNNTYTLSTPMPLVFGLTYPTSGTFRVMDAAGGRIDFVTVNSTLYFDLYLPGDSVRDAQTITTWSALVSQ